MTEPQESARPTLQYRAPSIADEATTRMSIANAAPGTVGFAYTPPDHAAGADAPTTPLGLVWRIVASLVLAAVGINAVAVIVRTMIQPEPAWVAALGMAVVAMLALAYPVVNVLRLVRTARLRRQRPTA